jgi:hypothetical protein
MLDAAPTYCHFPYHGDAGLPVLDAHDPRCLKTINSLRLPGQRIRLGFRAT